MTTVKIGDKVKISDSSMNRKRRGSICIVTKVNNDESVTVIASDNCEFYVPDYDFELVSDKAYQTWRDTSDEDKGKLLLAQLNGSPIQYSYDGITWETLGSRPAWANNILYRVKPQVETFTLYVSKGSPAHKYSVQSDTHKITYDVVDGVIQEDTVKMKKL